MAALFSTTVARLKLGERQDCISLSSCEAEIPATSATSKKVVDFRNLCKSVSESGLPIPDAESPTVLLQRQ
jgi:hypothetical protein